ncbi:hypothetical protein HMPREF0793_1854 [Staphylococcus caprae M23864:W1]|nr:hypothetical protein HMPREF0793_1854 [Staphylococcus caprae M23864:W1]PAK63256.1 hypothetical protein B9K00_12250 [Staphylococcus caprae]QDW94301.1 hypothetical protein DWB96_08745 [Staphylococcus caprae]BAW91117.1 hypothetical protein JMUB0001_1619 [Staphylococcus capitis]CQD31659.1 conserved hypothetical protein [Staphylococcus capitis]
MENTLFQDLKVGDSIWFKSPYTSYSHWGTVESLNFNFEGKSYVNVKVGVETVLRAYENYTFIRED